MDLCEERVDDAPPLKVSLMAEHDIQTKAENPVQQEGADSPEPSCVSMRRHSMDEKLIFFGHGNQWTEQRVQQVRADSRVPECVSVQSDFSMDPPLCFTHEHQSAGQRVHKETSEVTAGHCDDEQNKTDLSYLFMHLEENIITFVKTELKRFQRVLSPDYPECFENLERDKEGVHGEEDEQRKSSKQALLKITLHFLRRMKQEELADCLQNRTLAAVCQNKLKGDLKEKFQCFFEGIAKAGNPTLLNESYTELYITEGGSRGVMDNDGHGTRETETISSKASKPETVIRCEDIFKPLPGRDHQPVRTVLTKGEAGMGKTVLTQKFTLDWAEDKTNQNIQFTFPFTFRELNLLSGKKYSLIELVHRFFAETKAAEMSRFDRFSVVFIFDGLDECRLPLDFHNNEILTDVREPATVDVLLTNLIRGRLLPSARLWITSRPAAANQIPPGCVDMVTEVRGFTDSQMNEYFRKRFRDEEQAGRIISHIKTSRSLHIMCHIPVFCWITASVLEDRTVSQTREELPRSLTEMYIHFLVVQSKVGNVKYCGGTETDPLWKTETSNTIMSLGKLAFEHLQKGNLIFYESELRECDIDIRAASVYSGVFTQILKQENELFQEKAFCFVHLSIQEFLAALYVDVTFINTGTNLLSDCRPRSRWSLKLRDKSKVNPLCHSAMDKAIQSPNGHLDLFLRFLLGFSLETNQTLLQELLIPLRSSLKNHQETVKYIKKKIRRNPSPEKCINLFHCLNELNDHSLVEEIQQYLSSDGLSTDKLSPSQWSALVFILLSSEKDLEEFDLRKYSASEEGLLRLLQVVKASRISCLRDCKLSERSCEPLAGILQSKSSCVRELDLSNNDLQDSGAQQLFVGLASPHCRLETLRLSGCNLSGRSSEVLASILSSSSLRELDLSNNDLQDSGVKLLLAGVASSQCRLETLRLSGCKLSEQSSEALGLIISIPSSSLREMDLSNNDLLDSGVRLLSVGLASPHCRLETLRLSGCQVTEEGCTSLVLALNSNPSTLKVLDLSYNNPGESGMKLLSERQENPHWKLDTLCVDHSGRHCLKPMYARGLTLDPNTANRRLSLSEDNRKVTEVKEEQPYPDHPDRFHHWKQVLCREALSSSCYWEVEWKGWVNIGVTYRGLKRKGAYDECCLGENNKSWGLFCSDNGYSVCHDKRTTDIRGLLSFSGSGKVGVYLDWPACTLSFYRVSANTLTHLHTFHCTFTEPLYPAFRFNLRSESFSSVSLCEFEK